MSDGAAVSDVFEEKYAILCLDSAVKMKSNAHSPFIGY